MREASSDGGRRRFRSRAWGLAAVVIAGGAGYAGFERQTPEPRAQTISTDPASLYQLFEAKGLKSVEFANREWAYHVEVPAKDKLYIAGVKGANTQAEAIAAFAQTSSRKTADLMIVVCGEKFGDDPCDFYSPVHEVPRNGRAIQPEAVAQYQAIIDVAGAAARR